MKKLFLLTSLCIATFALNAKVITVSNNSQIPADYASLQDALDNVNAQELDTIYVYGSATNYGTVYVKTPVVLIGAGYAPQNANMLATSVDYIYFNLNTTLLEDASGSSISGFNVYRMYGPAESVTVTRCQISYLQPKAPEWLIYNNIIERLEYSEAFCEAHNNIIKGAMQYTYTSKVIIQNNLFIGSGNALYDVDSVIFSGNIYYGKNPLGSYSENNQFSRNLSFGNENTVFVTGTQTGGGNYESVNPLFSKTSGLEFNAADNYTLQEKSPIFDAGIGIHAGLYPWPMKAGGTMDFTGMPRIPQIVEMNVLNASIPVGGTLNVQLKARAQN